VSSPIIEVIRGDITAQTTDAIVNAANSSLMGGGGVDGAIHAAAGPELLAECMRVRSEDYPDGLPTGAAIATGAGALAASFVIHTVGPRAWEYPDGGAGLLAECHRSCLAEARRVGARSIAFPAISCGVYGWRPIDAAPIALRAVREESAHDTSVELVRFVLFNDDAYTHFRSALTPD